jgi:hypothetical protein
MAKCYYCGDEVTNDDLIEIDGDWLRICPDCREFITDYGTAPLDDYTGDNTTVTVTKGGVAISAGTDVLTYGDEIVITAEASEGYTLSTFTINGTSYATAQTITVSGNVAVVTAATEA